MLRVERAGLDDNFFDLGGDSLLLLAVHSNLQKTLHIEIPDHRPFRIHHGAHAGGAIDQAAAGAAFIFRRAATGAKQREAFARERERHSGGAS